MEAGSSGASKPASGEGPHERSHKPVAAGSEGKLQQGPNIPATHCLSQPSMLLAVQLLIRRFWDVWEAVVL